MQWPNRPIYNQIPVEIRRSRLAYDAHIYKSGQLGRNRSPGGTGLLCTCQIPYTGSSWGHILENKHPGPCNSLLKCFYTPNPNSLAYSYATVAQVGQILCSEVYNVLQCLLSGGGGL